MNCVKQPLFKCKTDNAFHIKILSELLSNILNTGFFEINKAGITISMFDQPRKTMISIQLDAENFQTYSLNSKESLHIGMNTSHFHKMLKSVKKKDFIELSIESENLSDLIIKTIPKEHNRVTVSGIKIQSAQNLDVAKPVGYTKSIIIQSSDFSKMIKDLSVVSSDVFTISNTDDTIRFSADSDGIVKRDVTFGNGNDTSTCEFDTSNTFKFGFEQLQRISKISSLSNSVYVYPCTEDLPLHIKSMVGSIGTLSIFIKSNEMLEIEHNS